MKKIKHIKFILSLLSLVMLITSAGIAPINSMAADTACVVSCKRKEQWRI